jgi:ssDNA-binding Zn-finger/Zn-ribbon topoisomerase 1
MMFERASSECNDIILRLGRKRNRAEEAARMNGEAPPDFYDLVIEEVKQVRAKFDNLAKEYFDAHKRLKPELDECGCENLLVAIVQSWAADFEKAMSSRDDNKADRLANLRTEADHLVRDTTVKRIERTHKEFVKTAHERILEIIEDTEKAKKRKDNNGYLHTDYYREEMRNRCPLCGNAMYAKRIKSDLYLVKCTNCYLSEIVKVES